MHVRESFISDSSVKYVAQNILHVSKDSVFTDASQTPTSSTNSKKKKARGTFFLPVSAYANLVFMQICQPDLYV